MFKFSKQKGNWIFVISVLLIILLFGFIIRIYHLTILPVFADEAIYVRWSQVMGAEATLRFLPLSDGKQPLYMWILMFIVRRFSDPLFVGRFISILSGLGTILGIFVLSYLLFKNKVVSLLASFLWVVSPIAFFFDRMALVDSMLAMFGVWTIVFGVITVKTKRLDAAMIGGFMLGFALLTKSPALFFTLLLPTTWLFADLPKVRNFRKISLHILGLVGLTLVTYIIGYGMYNILRLGPDFSQITSRNLDYVFPISHLWTNPKDPFIFHIAEIFSDWFIKMGPGIGLLLLVLGVLFSFKKFWKEVGVIFVWFLIPLIIQSEYAKVFTVRYILFTVPFFVILCSISILSIKSNIIKKIIYVLVGIFILQALLFDRDLILNPSIANLPSSERSGYLEEWSAGTGIKEVSDYIKNVYITDPNAHIVIGTEGFFGTLPDGLQIYLNVYPKITVIGTGLDFTDVPSQLKAAFKAHNETYFVVNTSRIQIKPENYAKFGLKLIASYPKALRREHESREYVLYGPQESLLFFKIVEPVSIKPAKI